MQRAQKLAAVPPDFAEQVAGAKAQVLAAGRDVIDLASGELDLLPPLAVREELSRLAADPSAYGDVSALADFRQAAVRWYAARFGVNLDAESEITEIAGIKLGLAQTLWAALNPGDIVLVPDLIEPWVKASIVLAAGVPYNLPLEPDSGWLPDLPAIPGEIVRQAKLLLLNCSNNPTGALANSSFFQDAVNFAQETGVSIVNDAAYASFGYDGCQAPSILKSVGAKEIAVELHSLPLFGSAFAQIGFMAGSEEAIRAIRRVKAATSSPMPDVLMRAAAWAMNHVTPDEMIATLTKRRDALVDGLNGLRWTVSKPNAGLFVWLPVPAGQTSASFAGMLWEQADVLTLPGPAFGPRGEGYVRLSLTVSEDRIQEAVRRMGHIA